MTNTQQIVIDIPADFQHHARLYEQAPPVHPDAKPRYGIVLPYSDAFAGCTITSRGHVYASSLWKPTLFIGEDNSEADNEAWRKLVEKADRWGVKPDVLLATRPLRVAVTLFKRPERARTLNGAALGVDLYAVQVLGDLTTCDALEQKIIAW